MCEKLSGCDYKKDICRNSVKGNIARLKKGIRAGLAALLVSALLLLISIPDYAVAQNPAKPYTSPFQTNSLAATFVTSKSRATNSEGASINDLLSDPVRSVVPGSSWYDLANQPSDAVKIVTEEVPHTVENDVSVFIGKEYAIVNGVETFLDAPPEIIPPGRTYVPVRFIAENLGYNVDWNGKERKVTLSTEGKVIELWINKKYADVNGERIVLDSAPFIDPKYDRTYLPFRWLAEQLGAVVSWDPNDTMGKKASFSLEKTVYEEVQHKEINPDSDSDKDGLSFDLEKLLGTNPNNAHTVSKFVTDKQVYDWAKKFGVNIKNYNPVNNLSITTNILFNLDPHKNDNITTSITDKQSLELYLSLGGSKVDFKSVYNSLHAFAGNLISRFEGNPEFVEGVFRGVKWGYIKPDKNIITTVGDETFAEIKNSYNNRAYEKKADGTEITLDKLINRERVATLIALNTKFGNNPINLLLSESQSIQQAAEKNNLEKYAALFALSNEVLNDVIPQSNITEKEAPAFSQVINQYDPISLGNYNRAEFIVKMWDKINENAELAKLAKGEYKKLFFAAADQFSRYIPNKQAVDEKVMPYVLNLAVSQFEYQIKFNMLRSAIASNDVNKVKDILNYFGFNNLNEQEQEKVMGSAVKGTGIERDLGNKYASLNLSQFSVAFLETFFSVPTVVKNKIFDNVSTKQWTYKEAIRQLFDTVNLEKQFILKLMPYNGVTIENEGDANSSIRKDFADHCPKLDFFDSRYSAISTAVISSIMWTLHWTKNSVGFYGGLPGFGYLFKMKNGKPDDTIESPLEALTRINQLTPHELKAITIYSRTYVKKFFDIVLDILNKYINTSVGIPSFLDSQSTNLFDNNYYYKPIVPITLKSPFGKEVTAVLPYWVGFQLKLTTEKAWAKSRENVINDWKKGTFVPADVIITHFDGNKMIPGAVASPIIATNPYEPLKPLEIDLGKLVDSALKGYKVNSWPGSSVFYVIKGDEILGDVVPLLYSSLALSFAGKGNLYEATKPKTIP